jgi:predicted CoA-binding protein
MRHSGALRRHQLVVPGRSRKALTKVARWTLYVSGALAVSFGLLVWPGNIKSAGGVHGLAGWLVIVSLWTLAGIAARAGVSRGLVWAAVGWGVLTALGASAQFKLPPGSAITALHVATGLGTFGLGLFLLKRVRLATRSAASATGTDVAIKDAAAEFLAKKRIAITGVSRKPESHGSNVVYRRLRERGYEVFAVNPNTAEVEGDRCFPDLKSIPGGVDAVVIGTRPERALATMRECADLGIEQVWMHRSVGVGSVSEEAAAWGRQHGLRVIAGGCPLMFDPAADTGHKIMLPLFTLTGKVPRRV